MYHKIQIVFFSFVLILTSCFEVSEHLFQNGSWVDLSHSYDSTTPYRPTGEGFKLDTVFEGQTEGGYYYSAFSFKSEEHGGTHIDAPVHFAKGKQSVDEISLDRLIGEAVVIDVTDSTEQYADYQIGIDDFSRWETIHGAIPDGAIVLLRTGYSKYWPR